MKLSPSLPRQRDDIQALVASGFGWLHSSRFWLLTIKDAARARAWLALLEASGLVTSIEQVGQMRLARSKPRELAAVAFSFAGLMKLGLVESPAFPFPTAFRSGMGSELRRQLLRDGEREGWGWSDHVSEPRCEPPAAVAHILLAVWWTQGPLPASVPPFDERAFSKHEVEGSPDLFAGDTLVEPFGFRDGISQPSVYGLKNDIEASPLAPTSDAQKEEDPDQIVAAGEFILGYRNEYDELSYCPDVEGWNAKNAGAHRGAHFTLNGSYLAVREIHQDLDAFARLDAIPAAGCPVGTTLAEAMMGRRKNGTPLGVPPGPDPAPGEEPNVFRYRVHDENGFVTPRGSHIRRANPRDTLGHDVGSGILSSKLHRLLRRGRPYKHVDEEGRTRAGLFFMACNTDLERQFEFIHQRWLRNPRFADLEDEDDPFVGASSPNRKFSVQGLPAGRSVSFASFTSTLGGGYFFLPGLKALRFIIAAEAADVDVSAAGSARTAA